MNLCTDGKAERFNERVEEELVESVRRIRW